MITSLKLFLMKARALTIELRRKWRKPKALKIIELPRKTRMVASGCCLAGDLPEAMVVDVERARKIGNERNDAQCRYFTPFAN